MPLSDLKYLLVMVRARPHHSSLLNSSCAGLLSARLRQTQATLGVKTFAKSSLSPSTGAPLARWKSCTVTAGPLPTKCPISLWVRHRCRLGLVPFHPCPTTGSRARPAGNLLGRLINAMEISIYLSISTYIYAKRADPKLRKAMANKPPVCQYDESPGGDIEQEDADGEEQQGGEQLHADCALTSSQRSVDNMQQNKAVECKH